VPLLFGYRRRGQAWSSSKRTAARVANTNAPWRWAGPAPTRSRMAFDVADTEHLLAALVAVPDASAWA
jgi:hypothetical protein